MLVELRVTQLGVIEDLTLTLGPGMTVLTGETGAGKTLVVEAISLLIGGRADGTMVRPGAEEARVEGRFAGTEPEGECILTRVIPASGRARAYVDGGMAAAAALADLGGRLVDLHGQHAHQSLLNPATQRQALDVAAGISTEALTRAARRVRDLTGRQAGLGGDARARAHELDLVRFQSAELDAARLVNPTEDAELREEEERLSHASSLRLAAASVADRLTGDEGLVDQLGALVEAVRGPGALEPLSSRLLSLQADLSDVGGEARLAAESFEDDPDRLAEVNARRQLLTDLRRKYGDTLTEVMTFHESARRRIAELEDLDRAAATLDADLIAAREEQGAAEAAVGRARRAAAAGFAAAVETTLQGLAMPAARFEVRIGPDPAGAEVTWLLGANPGEPLLPLAKVASGGELARAMLAVRLVLTDRRQQGNDQRQQGNDQRQQANDQRQARNGPGRLHPPRDGDAELPSAASGEEVEDPPTLVFDEVDAGIGGEAAVAVGRALAALGQRHQVLVVTHLPQVAAFGDRHLVVRKQATGARTVASVEVVDGPARVVELSRMLSGRPNSATARRHAEELLAQRQPLSPL